MNISIIGAGYVGLCTAVGFSCKGYRVIVYDSDCERIDRINKGNPTFYEPGLKELLRKSLKDDTLRTVRDVSEAISLTDLTFVAVGTPSKPDGDIDLSYLEKASANLGEALAKKKCYHLVVIKSTVIPTTTLKIVKSILELKSGKKIPNEIGLCTNPEFLREGSAIDDTLNPDRVIIGELDTASGDMLEELYQKFYDKTAPIIRMDTSSAEMVKYASNAFLATKVSFINEIANVCESIPNMDVTVIAKGMGFDHRINPYFLSAGCGWGGSCFGKDLSALTYFSQRLGFRPEIMKATVRINEFQAKHMVDLAKADLGDISGKNMAVLGLAFKPETDDVRDAQSIKIVSLLLAEGAKVSAYDPLAMANAKRVFKNKIKYANSVDDCLKAADCCFIVTECKEFRKLKPEKFLRVMKNPMIIDGRRIFDPDVFSKNLNYHGIGLGPISRKNR